MSVPAPPSQHRSATVRRGVPAVPLATLVVSAAAAGAVVVTAPAGARAWAGATAAGAWIVLAVTVIVSAAVIRRARRTGAQQAAETDQFKARLAQTSAEAAHLANAVLPAVAERLRDDTGAAETLSTVAQPSDPHLRQVLHTFAAVVEEYVQHAAALDTERRQVREELGRAAAEQRRLTEETLPAALARLREGQSADTVLADLDWPHLPLLRLPAESFVRELAHSERRAAAAQAASAKALSRVQAKAVSMLADLRDMQERHGEEVFGDLLKLDHSTSQLGLMTDRLALLMGGRSSRAWNKPIVMESILRGAVGRIAAYRRVRLHCSTTAAVSGFAAEGVMHLLAELMDNAANFSPPIDEVHVYVEERSAGIVVTIEDSGLKMATAAMRRAEDAVSGRVTDLASLQGTRLGLPVVGRLAVKYGISVNYRPSSRGGTGVVVLLPPQLMAQQREPAPMSVPLRPAAVPASGTTSPATEPHPASTEPAARPHAGEQPAPAEPGPVPLDPPSAPDAPHPLVEPRSAPVGQRPAPAGWSDAERSAVRAGLPEQGGPDRGRRDATPNGLPVRTPGRTMAEADREREQRRSSAAEEDDGPSGPRPPRDAGSRFGAFHRGRRSGSGDTGQRPGAESGPPLSS